MNKEDLSDEDLERLLSNPEVQKTIQYGDVGLTDLADDLAGFANDEDNEDVYNLFTQGVADRSGRVTQQTVEKVISGMIEEVNDVTGEDE